MRTPAQRGRIGNWLRDERLARSWASQDVARANLERAGIKVAPSVYAEWESGTRVPNEPMIARLEAFYGPMAASGGATTQPEVAALVASLEALVQEMRLARETDQRHQREEIAAAVREAVEPLWTLVRAATPPPEEPSPEPETRVAR